MSAGLSHDQFRAMADFRFRLRQFLAFSEAAAVAAGLSPQQHQALLAIAGHVGAAPPSVGTIADALIIAPHSAAGLVARMVERGLVTKRAAVGDRRRQELFLTDRAAALLGSLTTVHLAELAQLRDVVVRALADVP